MIDRAHDLPITKQAQVLRISRGSVYYLPRPVPATDLEVMRRLDRLHLEFSFAGSRMLRGLLAAEGCKIGRRHVKTLMRRMGMEALYRRPRTTKPEPGHKIYPYRLRGIEITRPNQVWAMDITYIPMARGFVYLAVVLDWFSRRVLSWRLSIVLGLDPRMEAAFCVETLEDALARHGKPDIFNTDQGSQFTGVAFTGALAANGIAISMDGKGAWRDNVFVERLWRSVKYEEVYLRAYDGVSEARTSIGRYLNFYNGRRPHSSLQTSALKFWCSWSPTKRTPARCPNRKGDAQQTEKPSACRRLVQDRWCYPWCRMYPPHEETAGSFDLRQCDCISQSMFHFLKRTWRSSASLWVRLRSFMSISSKSSFSSKKSWRTVMTGARMSLGCMRPVCQLVGQTSILKG